MPTNDQSLEVEVAVLPVITAAMTAVLIIVTGKPPNVGLPLLPLEPPLAPPPLV